MDEDEYRMKSIELHTKQVLLTEEQNKKIDKLATRTDVEHEGEKTRAVIPKNGIKDQILILVIVALIVLAGAEKVLQVLNGG